MLVDVVGVTNSFMDDCGISYTVCDVVVIAVFSTTDGMATADDIVVADVELMISDVIFVGAYVADVEIGVALEQFDAVGVAAQYDLTRSATSAYLDESFIHCCDIALLPCLQYSIDPVLHASYSCVPAVAVSHISMHVPTPE